MKLKDLLKGYRQEHNISMERLADLCELSKGYISMLESGKNPKNKKEIVPSLLTLRKIARGTGMEFTAFLDMLDDQNVSLVSEIQEFTADEKDIINKYRYLDERGKLAVRETVDREYSFVRPDTDIEGKEA